MLEVDLVWSYLTVYLDVDNPKMMFITGCVGLALNLISAVFLHGTVPGVLFVYYANGV